ncbi:MAG: cobalt-precorrin-5B (C(1))-methyltransferase CbiD [Desulfovibrio sp.]|jgi:cobalt-precorrin-5B (C1)-methyltransferase|nr:cobalt-precorrin-5B (C(1))-methyltransferase CbiD [Desulfovibrio sp.]
MKHTLRDGFTTGTAASAAAGAAARALLEMPPPDSVSVALPPFVHRGNAVEPENDARIVIPIAESGPCPTARQAQSVFFASVIKDGGDDPDATHGARLTAMASLTPFVGPEVSLPAVIDYFSVPVWLYAGKGIGRVTLPGLPVPPGEAAINPVPRKQIALAVNEAVPHGNRPKPSAIHVLLQVDDGEERARRTLNPRLGIVGGISILGTQGIVKPYSHASWQAAIRQGMDVASALGLGELLLSTGRRSERLGFGLYPDLPPQAGVQVADYAAFALGEAARHSFSRLIWLCFPGKLLKMAQGLGWTHAQSAPADIALVAALCRESGGADLAESVAAMPTAAGAFAVMAQKPQVHASVLRSLAEQALATLAGFLKDAGDAGRTALRLHIFDPDERLLLTLERAG